jgi:hypothetical protein
MKDNSVSVDSMMLQQCAPLNFSCNRHIGLQHDSVPATSTVAECLSSPHVIVSPTNETCAPTAEHNLIKKQRLVVVAILICTVSLLTITSWTYRHDARIDHSSNPFKFGATGSLRRPIGSNQNQNVQETEFDEDLSTLQTTVKDSDYDDDHLSFETVEQPGEEFVMTEWPPFDEEEFYRRLDAIPDEEYDDERALQAIPKKKVCPTYPTPKALQAKKGFAATLRPPGQIGSYAQNVPRVRTMSVGWNYSWGPDRIAQQPPKIGMS